MAHFLFRARYTREGIAGVLKDGGSGRAKAIKKLVESAGGKVEVGYWAFGEDDYILIAELPDNAAAVALAATVGASGAASITTTVLVTGDEIDAAAKQKVTYRAPGS
ncbi:MAG: GYD domain-containing protein [Candidatus Limnocylindrales bacterium]